MAMGVSSYSDRGGRRRRRAAPRTITYGERTPRVPWLGRLEQTALEAWPLLRLPLTLLAVVYLVAVALFPGGRNALFDVRAADTPALLSMFQVPDSFGFYTGRDSAGFLVYKIYTQDGGVVDGIFPDTGVAPRMRYDRWAVAGNAASGPHPKLHAFVARYVLNELPSPPVRMELYSARWGWDRNSLTFPWPGSGPETLLELQRLGSYNGLTRTWEPVQSEAPRR